MKNTIKKIDSKVSSFWLWEKTISYLSIVIGSAVAFLSSIYTEGFWFYFFSLLGLLIAIFGQVASDWLERKIRATEAIELFAKKNTPPKFTLNLKYKDPKNYLFVIRCDNLIPLKFKIMITNEINNILSGIQMDWIEIHPTVEQNTFNCPISLNQSPGNIIKLGFNYQSIWMGEINRKELGGNVTQTYTLSGGTLTFISEIYN